jgi:hypothetical protein
MFSTRNVTILTSCCKSFVCNRIISLPSCPTVCVHMERLLNKPKVFLSHSSSDKPFIERLASDLRKCQIDPWLDTEEIRDGRSWMKVIFQDGIPTCDAVLVYFTEHSLKSKMVEQELDAGILHQLDNGGVILLPYVSQVEIRERLRIDLRTRHCRQWNEQNYHELLPTVVAEIWHSYLERNIETALLKEKNRRLELEIELNHIRELQQETIFSPKEETDFTFIKGALENSIRVGVMAKIHIKGKYPPTNDIGEDVFDIAVIDIVTQVINSGSSYIEDDFLCLQLAVMRILERLGYPKAISSDSVPYLCGDVHISRNIITELMTLGLLNPARHVSADDNYRIYYDFSEKMFRFLYWLQYNEVDGEADEVEYIARISIEDRDLRRYGFVMRRK